MSQITHDLDLSLFLSETEIAVRTVIPVRIRRRGQELWFVIDSGRNSSRARRARRGADQGGGSGASVVGRSRNGSGAVLWRDREARGGHGTLCGPPHAGLVLCRTATVNNCASPGDIRARRFRLRISLSRIRFRPTTSPIACRNGPLGRPTSQQPLKRDVRAAQSAWAIRHRRNVAPVVQFFAGASTGRDFSARVA